MFKILLVEDEIFMRKGIIKLIDWEDLDLKLHMKREMVRKLLRSSRVRK